MKINVSKRTFYEITLEDGSVLQLSPDELESVYSGLKEIVQGISSSTSNEAVETPEPISAPMSSSEESLPSDQRKGRGDSPVKKRRARDSLRNPVVIILVALMMVGAGWFAGYLVAHPSANAKAGNGSLSAYDFTIVITTNNWFNDSIGFEPAFYVLQNNQLVSTANISLPANVPVNITIVNYDDGPAPVPAQFENVTGTVGNVVYIANDTTINSTQPISATGISVTSSQPVSWVTNTNMAHTFTIFRGSTQIVNIPIEPSAVETATFTLSSGFYHWHCEAACGSGLSGWGGAMQTPGWMAGVVNVA